MDNFSIRGENLFQDIFSDVGVKTTNEYLSSTTNIVSMGNTISSIYLSPEPLLFSYLPLDQYASVWKSKAFHSFQSLHELAL
ncbi:hypothetical protein EE612_025686 [Oryza sativa]|nr:hypothetical protein EE612_025686 [Oryza sativa]